MLVSNIPSHDLLLVTLGRGVAFASPTHMALPLLVFLANHRSFYNIFRATFKGILYLFRIFFCLTNGTSRSGILWSFHCLSAYNTFHGSAFPSLLTLTIRTNPNVLIS